MSILSDIFYFIFFAFATFICVYLRPILSVIFNFDWHPADAKIRKTLVCHK
jgi:hypothetical protein